MTTPVSFEIAKLLKEKEFNKSTSKYFRYDGKECEYNPFNWNEDLGFYSRPTIAEVVCWIYTKYNIWIQISILRDNEWYYSIRRKENNWEIEFPTKEKFSSIEKAYEKGIEIVLNTYSPTS